MRDLSIIIVTYNPGDLILACLKSVEAASASLDAEIIVVDNASQDGTTERIKAQFSGVKVIANADNRGFAAACNQGLAAASGRYLMLLNPDTVVEPDTLAAMIRFMESHPRVGIAGPRALDSRGKVALTAFPEYEPWMILWSFLGLRLIFPYSVYGKYRHQCETATEPFQAAWLQGSCLMLNKDVYQDIGGLDESFFLFCEEPDYCECARQRGWEVWYLPNAHIRHFPSSTISQHRYIKERNYHISPLIYFRKRGRAGATRLLKLGFTLDLVGRIALFAPTAVMRRDLANHLKLYAGVMREMWAF